MRSYSPKKIILIGTCIILVIAATVIVTSTNYISSRGSAFDGNVNVTGNISIKGGYPYADAKAWGAKCDGITDDSRAIQNALNSIPSGNVLVPTGVCILTKQINISSNKVLKGTGVELGTTLQFNSGMTSALNASIYIYGSQAGIADMYIHSLNNRINVIRISSSFRPKVDNVKIVGGNKGINHIGGAEGRMNFIHIQDTTDYGFYSDQPDLYTQDLYVQNASTGVYVSGGAQVMIHTHVVYSRMSGISIVGGNYGQWFGCYVDTGGSHGFSIYDTNKLTISNCWLYKNGQVGTTKYGLYLDNVDDSIFIGIVSKANLTTMRDIYFDVDSSSNQVIGFSSERSSSADKNISYVDAGRNNLIIHSRQGILYSGFLNMSAKTMTINATINMTGKVITKNTETSHTCSRGEYVVNASNSKICGCTATNTWKCATLS